MDTSMPHLEPVELDERGWPTKGWLKRAYVDAGLGTRQIAQLTGRGVGRVSKLLREHGIETRQQVKRIPRDQLERWYLEECRPLEEIAALGGVPTGHVRYLIRTYALPVRRPIRRQFTPTREWLIEKYEREDLSEKQIRGLTGYSKGGLYRLLRQYGIEPKGHSLPPLEVARDELHRLHVVEGLTAVRIAARLGCHHSSISRLIREYGLDPARPLVNIRTTPPLSRDELWKLYWVDMLSTGALAERFGVSKATARRWMRQLDVPTRKWNGGEVKRTYTRQATDPRAQFEFNATERERIQRRDGYHCRMPGCGITDAWRLEVHHIVPIQYGGTNGLDNGITLCRDCHSHITRRELEFASLLQSLIEIPATS